MRDPRDAGHTPSGCDCCYERCAKCDTVWPCPTVAEYDAKIEKRERRKRLPEEFDQLTKRVNDLESQLKHQRKFIFGAVLPVIRDLLATHAMGSLVIPPPTWAIDADPHSVESGMGVGVNFASSGERYEYESTDGRVYTDGKVTRGAVVAKVSEQLRRKYE